MDEIIESLKNLSELSVKDWNEENVKIRVVVKLLHILGYSDEYLDLEHSYGANRADILVKFDFPIAIEVKGSSTDINNHITQIRGYSYDGDAYLSMITNGVLFYIFSPFWRQKSFKDRVLLSFHLNDLVKKEIAEEVISLLYKPLGYEKILDNIEKLENYISDNKEKIKSNERLLVQYQDELEKLEKQYVDINKLEKVIEHLEPTTKTNIKKYIDLKEKINDIHKTNKSIKEHIPSIERVQRSNSYQVDKNNNVREISSTIDNFSMGISDEVINIRALQEGKQIVLCKTQQKTNNYVFLLPKSTFISDFTPSKNGLKYSYPPINTEFTKYIAKIEYLPIPGLNKNFWQELYDEGEFDLWDIENGPLKYFQRTNRRKILFWIFRVYEMPFEIKLNEDYTPPRRLSSRLINNETLQRIQNGFDKGEFSPVISDDEYESRKSNIKAIADKGS